MPPSKIWNSTQTGTIWWQLFLSIRKGYPIFSSLISRIIRIQKYPPKGLNKKFCGGISDFFNEKENVKIYSTEVLNIFQDWQRANCSKPAYEEIFKILEVSDEFIYAEFGEIWTALQNIAAMKSFDEEKAGLHR